MLVASTSAWLTSTSASALKRRSRCSNASGMVLNEVMTKVALMATTTSGSCGAWKNRPNGSATTQETSRLPSPRSTAKLLSWLICSTLSSRDRKSTRLNSSHLVISYAVFCLKKKKKTRCSVLSTQVKSSEHDEM